MAITYIEIDTAQLDKDTVQLENSIDSVRKALDALQTEFEELNGMWEGTANLAFRVQVASDEEALSEMLSEMQKLADCMQNASKEYVKCEDAVHNMVDNIRI
jgi:WXG100 family type VII secretion target